jgi:hypothetical protein
VFATPPPPVVARGRNVSPARPGSKPLNEKMRTRRAGSREIRPVAPLGKGCVYLGEMPLLQQIIRVR